MTESEFLRKIDVLVNLPVGTLKGSERLSELKSWDSMVAVEFLALADAELSASIRAQDLATCSTVADLLKLVEREFSV